MSKVEGQYTLDADPMILAARVKELEQATDILCGVVVDLINVVRVLDYECDLAFSEDHPHQAANLNELYEDLNHLHDKAHAASTHIGRSY